MTMLAIAKTYVLTISLGATAAVLALAVAICAAILILQKRAQKAELSKDVYAHVQRPKQERKSDEKKGSEKKIDKRQTEDKPAQNKPKRGQKKKKPKYVFVTNAATARIFREILTQARLK